MYRIRNKRTGKFHVGGLSNYDSSWNSCGKIWTTLGKLRSMITNTIRHATWGEPVFDEWEIIEYELTEVAVKEVNEIVTPEKLLELLRK